MRALLILFALLAMPALAADPTPSPQPAEGLIRTFSPPVGDLSANYLGRIFGTVHEAMKAGATGNPEQNAVGAYMGVFNLGVLLLGMFFVVFTTIKGTLDSAHDGELLGKRMSSIWVPLRTIGGAAFLLPLTSGYSFLQMVVMWLALNGVGLADVAWNATLDKLALTGTLGRVSVPDARPLAANILRAEVCMAALNQQFESEGRSTRISVLPLQDVGLGVDGAKATRWRWGAFDYVNPAVCGSISWVQSAADKKTEDMTLVARQPILDAHIHAVGALALEMRVLAKKIVVGQYPELGAVDMAAARYEDAVAKAAKAAVDLSPENVKKAFTAHAKDGGWILAGTWFTQMSRYHDAMQAAVNTIPTSTPVRIEDVEAKQSLVVYGWIIDRTDEYLKNRGEAPRRAYEMDIEDAKLLRTSDEVWRYLSIPAMAALDGITQRIAGANTSPLLQLRAVGNDIISAGLAVKGTMFALAGFAGSRASDWTLGNVFNVSEALKTISGFVEFLSSGILAAGLVLAYYLPAIPSIWFMLAAIRWLAGVAEAVLASPLMAAFIMAPSGDDTVGRAGPGMLLIAGLVFMPVLIIGGFILSVVMTYPAGELVNATFMTIVSGTSGASGVGVTGLLAYSALYMLMMVTAMHACFALIQAVPDAVMRYVGGQAGPGSNVADSGRNAPAELKSNSEKAGTGVAKGAGDRHSRSVGGKSGGGASHENGFTHSNKDLLG